MRAAHKVSLTLLACLAALASGATLAWAAAGDSLQHASRTTGLPGSPANGVSETSRESIGVNALGQTLVAFSSFAPNLGSNLNYQVYVRNLATGDVTLVSKSTGGTVADTDAEKPAISGNGRYVAFQTLASLHASDGDDDWDVYRHDLETGATIPVSLPNGGTDTENSSDPSISHDGNVIAFYSVSDLVPADDTTAPDNFDGDVYARNVGAGTTTMISVTASNAEVPFDNVQNELSISGDGTIVAFVSDGDLSSNDSSTVGGEVYVRSVDGSTPTEAVSLTDSDTSPSDGSFSTMPAVDYDGSHVAFKSDAMNLTGLAYNRYNIIVRNRTAGSTAIASLASDGSPGNDTAIVDRPAISDDGRFVAFETEDTSFHPGAFEDDVEIYLRDMALPNGASLISRTPTGEPGHGQFDNSAYNASVSPDGSAVAFTTDYTNILDAFGASTSPDYSQVFIGGAGDTPVAPPGGGPGPGIAPPPPPTLSAAKLAKKKFKAGKKLGTKLTVTASEAGTLTGTYLKGKKKAGSFTAKLKAGKNTVKVTGLVKRKKLKPGKYKLTLTVKSPNGTSAVKTLTLTILKS